MDFTVSTGVLASFINSAGEFVGFTNYAIIHQGFIKPLGAFILCHMRPTGSRIIISTEELPSPLMMRFIISAGSLVGFTVTFLTDPFYQGL